MPDLRRASDVPDSFRRKYIKDFYADYGQWPGSTEIHSTWTSMSAEHQSEWLARFEEQR